MSERRDFNKKSKISVSKYLNFLFIYFIKLTEKSSWAVLPTLSYWLFPKAVLFFPSIPQTRNVCKI